MSSTESLKAAATGQQPAAAVATKKEPPKSFPAMLTVWKGEIANALPKHLNADRMARIALTCFRNTPKLGDCNPHSVFAAVLQAAQLGIEPGLTGEAYLIPFKDTCQLIPGYMGLIKLAKQTGQVTDIYAMSVREHDKFSCTFGLDRKLEHQPKSGKGGFPASQAERGEIIGVYAVAVFKDGSRTFVLLGKDEIDRIRDGSQGYKTALKYGKKDTPWITHYEEMALKTAIRRLCKTLPKSPELATALSLEDQHNAGRAQNIDMKDALAGDYTPPAGDIEDAEIIDAETGEVKPATGSSGEPPKDEQPKQPDQQPVDKAKATARPVSMKSVIAMIGEGKYAEARDLVRAAPYTDGDRAEVESAVKKHQAGEKV